jgi:hypothetical protein
LEAEELERKRKESEEAAEKERVGHQAQERTESGGDSTIRRISDRKFGVKQVKGSRRASLLNMGKSVVNMVALQVRKVAVSPFYKQTMLTLKRKIIKTNRYLAWHVLVGLMEMAWLLITVFSGIVFMGASSAAASFLTVVVLDSLSSTLTLLVVGIFNKEANKRDTASAKSKQSRPKTDGKGDEDEDSFLQKKVSATYEVIVGLGAGIFFRSNKVKDRDDAPRRAK